MIAAQKRMLKANLTEGMLGIQANLVHLYSSNLSAVATQAALIAGFAFTACTTELSTSLYTTDDESTVLAYFYFVFFTICFVAALFCLSQATIVVMFGPSMSLKGESEEAVKVAAERMRVQQGLIFFLGVISISSLFIGACIQCWSLYPRPIAAICTFCYLVGYILLVHHGRVTYEYFIRDPDITLLLVKDSALNKSATLKGDNPTYVVEKTENEKLQEAFDMVKSRCQGTIWRRIPLEEGGTYSKCYAVLEKGKVDMYKSENDYFKQSNPLIKVPIKLWNYYVETDQKKFRRNIASIRNVFKAAILGNGEFGVKELLTSEHDLAFASENYKFALIPRLHSELVAMDNVEFICHDEKSYKQWVYTLSTVCDAYQEIASNPTCTDTLAGNASDVEFVVKAANVIH